MISSNDLAGTIVQRGRLEKATLVPRHGWQYLHAGHAAALYSATGTRSFRETDGIARWSGGVPRHSIPGTRKRLREDFP
jgi:hypothetical protein